MNERVPTSLNLSTKLVHTPHVDFAGQSVETAAIVAAASHHRISARSDTKENSTWHEPMNLSAVGQLSSGLHWQCYVFGVLVWHTTDVTAGPERDRT